MDSRAYQSSFPAIHAAAIAAGHKNVLLVLPVGSGKTYVARLVIEAILPKKRHDIWVLQHRNELGFQFHEELADLGAVLLAGQKELSPTPLRIAGRDSMTRREILPLYDCALLIIDEGHVGVCASYERLLARFAEKYRVVYVLLLTATPERLDGKPIGRIVSKLIEPVRPAELFDAGIIMEPQVIGAAMPELGGVSLTGGDFDCEQVAQRSRTIIGDVIKEAHTWTGGLPFVVRATTIAHAADITQRLCESGFRAELLDGSMPYPDRNLKLARLSVGGHDSTFAPALDAIVVSKGGLLLEGWNPQSDYKRLLCMPQMWATPEQINSVSGLSNEAIALRLIQSGVMPPVYRPVSTLSDCAPTMSRCQYRQFEGRVDRVCGEHVSVCLFGTVLRLPAVPKTFARIISHSGNWQRHGFLRDYHTHSLTKPASKPRLAADGGLVGARYCPVCLSIWPSGRTVCSCGSALSTPKPPPEDTAEPLRLIPAGAMPKASQSQVVAYLRSLWLWWAKENARRRAVGKPEAKEGQVRAVYYSRAGRWPNAADLAESKRLAFEDKKQL